MSEKRDKPPLLECDLVMRGGITSGIVYPKAVAELANSYRFRSIGGTSAGAIAAVVTAAAEYCRQKIIAVGQTESSFIPFLSVAKIPEELSKRDVWRRTFLFRLFQPQARTAPLFHLFVAATAGPAVQKSKDGKKTKEGFEDRFLAIGKGIVRAFPLASFLGALPGLILGLSIVAGLTREYWERESTAWMLFNGVPDFLLFGLLPSYALGWISSSALFMLIFVGLCGAGLWFSRRAFLALAMLIFVVPLGLVILPAYMSYLGLSLEGADDFSQFSIQFGLAISVLSALVGALLTSLIMMGRRAISALPENMYGICSGLTTDEKYGAPGVTDWLHNQIQRVAGRTEEEAPLTMGDLWDPVGTAKFGEDVPSERNIDLSLMVTNVTRGISHKFPFLEGWRGSLYFRVDEFLELFPRSVVEHLVRHAQMAEGEVQLGRGHYRLPAPRDLPLIVGARMSMSYPYLLSAIPLYAVDWSRVGTTNQYELKKCWFSDGGLTSNFPINLFDRPLPTRPTFGINLVPDTARHHEVLLHEASEEDVDAMSWNKFGLVHTSSLFSQPETSNEDQSDEALWNDVWMPRRNNQDLFKVIRFNDFEKDGGSIGGFFGALFDTAMNWADTELTHMPGYRDRIVHVELKPNEGGMNLNMPDDVIQRIGKKGRLAGQMLASRFAPEPGEDPRWGGPVQLSWENHRWVRYRATMAALEHVARDLVSRLREEAKQPGTKSYRDLLENSLESTSHCQWASREQYLFARQATEDLADFISRWTSSHETFDRVSIHADPNNDGIAPRPKAMFKVVPPSDADPQLDEMPRM